MSFNSSNWTLTLSFNFKSFDTILLGELGGRFQSTCITTKNATCVAEWVFNLKNTMGSDCLWDSILKYGNGTNELEGMQAEFSAQIVHAVNLHSLHFSIICLKISHISTY